MKLLTVIGYLCVLVILQDHLVLSAGYSSLSNDLPVRAAILAKVLCSKYGSDDISCYRDKLLLANRYLSNLDTSKSIDLKLSKDLCSKNGETDLKCYKDLSSSKEWGSAIKRISQGKGFLQKLLRGNLNDQRKKRFFSDW
ncbi:hypothetical protein Ahia01_000684900 [Argonauta hians]